MVMTFSDALDGAEQSARQAGLLAVTGTPVFLLSSLWRGARRLPGRTSGREPEALRTPAFYLLASAGYFGLCYRLWRPLPVRLSEPARAVAVFTGILLFFPGLALVLWGRLALGSLYNVSSSFGAHLFPDHRLLTDGPFALVRHPMYVGILLVGIGGLLLYRTWTFALVLFHLPALVIRARREEDALEAEFGAQWVAYRRRVPPWVPRLLPAHPEGVVG